MNSVNRNLWVQKGHLSIWEYKDPSKAFRGLHVTCDKEGCQSIILLLNQLQDASRPRKRSVIISKPTENELKFPNYSSRKIWSPKKLKLLGHLGEENRNIFEFEKSADHITLELGEEKINELSDCFRRLMAGESDFTFRGDSKIRLNFW